MRLTLKLAPIALALIATGCTYTKTTDGEGNTNHAIALGKTQDKGLSWKEKLGLKNAQDTDALHSPSYENVFYMAPFGSRQGQISIQSNSFQARDREGNPILVDFYLGVDYNEEEAKRYLLSLLLEESCDLPLSIEDHLLLSIDEEKLDLEAYDISEVQKTKTTWTTLKGERQETVQVRRYRSVDYALTSEQFHAIVHANRIALSLNNEQEETLSGALKEDNMTVLREMSDALTQLEQAQANGDDEDPNSI